MTTLTLEKEVVEAKLCSPLADLVLDRQPIEYRRDPLTGMRSRINKVRAGRTRQTPIRVGTTFNREDASKKDCAFCPENLERNTPRFSVSLIPEGRIRRGSAFVFPNLYPFGGHHAISVFSGEHDPSLDSYSEKTICDCLSASIEYLKCVHRIDQDVTHASIGWNYLPPAGASMVHPHLQIVADRSPTHFQELLIKRSEEYFGTHATSYWRDLIETERELGERVICDGDKITWLASFAPKANDEVMAVLPDISSVTQVGEAGLAELSRGILAVLKGYSECGIESLNMALISGPLDRKLEHYALNLRMNSRPRLEQYYTNDSGFMERILLETIIESDPEEIAKKLQGHFRYCDYRRSR